MRTKETIRDFVTSTTMMLSERMTIRLAMTLTLSFTTANSIEAGKPYIVKWDGTSGTVSNPAFTNVTINSTTPTAVNFTGGSTLGYSQNPRTLRSFRAHFEVPSNANVRVFVLDFGDETTSLREISNEQLVISNYDYYTLDGRKLDGKPTKKGMYINKGRQVVIK